MAAFDTVDMFLWTIVIIGILSVFLFAIFLLTVLLFFFAKIMQMHRSKNFVSYFLCAVLTNFIFILFLFAHPYLSLSLSITSLILALRYRLHIPFIKAIFVGAPAFFIMAALLLIPGLIIGVMFPS